MEHIEDWSKVQKHDFENMIVLCATCHARVTSGEISKAAIRNYKSNLAIISGRYSLYEMRLFEIFRSLVDDPNTHYQIAKNDLLHVKGVVDDGLFQIIEPKGNVSIGNMVISPVYLKLTESGRKFIRHLMAGRAIE